MSNNSNLQLTVEGREKGKGGVVQKVIIYIVSISLSILSILPFWLMFVNATRSTPQIQSTAISFLPSTHLFDNIKILSSKNMFKPLKGFLNSFICAGGWPLLKLMM